LKANGERTFEDVLAEVGNAKPVGGLDVVGLLLAVWFSEICTNKGYLSREGTAARFLFPADRLAQLTRGDPKLAEAINEFADAWAWLHAELSGLHAFAVKGALVRRGAEGGNQSRSADSIAKEAIVRDEIEEYRKRETRPNRLKDIGATTDAVIGPVGERIQAAGLKPYTRGSLYKVVSKLMKLLPA
jgi:hypothetical protein